MEGQKDIEDHQNLKRISKIFPQTSKEDILIIHLIADACFHVVMVNPWKPLENNETDKHWSVTDSKQVGDGSLVQETNDISLAVEYPLHQCPLYIYPNFLTATLTHWP